MRRAFAAVLVLVFSFPLIAPALASVPGDAQLPACCRRGGKHHCAMSMGNMPSRYRVVQETCPFCPLAHPPVVMPHWFAPLPELRAAGLAAGTAAVVRAAEAGYRISADRTRHKRGPPESLVL